jgi:outer membrane protein assembly factor BamB
LPLIGAISQKMTFLNMPINAFYIRKCRKKTGFLNMTEGEVKDLPIIIVDDIINSGSSIIKCYNALSCFDKIPKIAFAVLSYKNHKYYKEFESKYKIKIETIFELSEFRDELKLDILESPENKPIINKYKIKWIYKNDKPNYFYVNPKSFPLVYKNNIYYGKDGGEFVCISSEGMLLWSYTIPYGSSGKTIFSTPAIHNNTVIFGAYDGNVYCLDCDTGRVNWVNFDCDWIGSSPDISIKNNLIYIGAEYGFWSKKGGLIAMEAETGELKWAFRDMPEYTHGSPLCIDQLSMVLCGSNDGFLYALDNKNGKLFWKLKCSGAIKHKPAFSKGTIVVADHRGSVIAVSKEGNKLWEYKMFFGSYCSPKIEGDNVYVTSFDKYIYCFDIRNGNVLWKDETDARIFSSAEIIKNKLYVGTNSGVLLEYDKNTGENISKQFFSERITNKIACSEKMDTIYVLDYVGNLYALDVSV